MSRYSLIDRLAATTPDSVSIVWSDHDVQYTAITENAAIRSAVVHDSRAVLSSIVAITESGYSLMVDDTVRDPFRRDRPRPRGDRSRRAHAGVGGSRHLSENRPAAVRPRLPRRPLLSDPARSHPRA